LEELEFTEAALAADPDTGGLAAPFQEEIAAWEALYKKVRESRRASVRADAVVSVRDERLDELTAELGGHLYVAAGRDRSSPLFRRFFPAAPSELVRQPLRKQAEQVKNVIVPELAKLEDGSPAKPFGEALGSTALGALTALDTRAELRGNAARVSAEVDEWKEGVNRLRTTTFAELLKLGTEKRRGRKWPDAFFRAADGAVEEETDAPAITPAGG
jgi:hypothetical protein